MSNDDRRPDSQSFAPLSQRERDILALLADDLSDRDIAERLVLAYTTVKWYNRQIFNKLGVENRQQAVERATDLGLLEQPQPADVTISHLPAPLTPFVGRISELDDLSRLLNHPNIRQVTILAPGGMGKTRLALAAAERVLRRFADGVYFVPLAPLTSPDQLLPTMAESIGLQYFNDDRPPKQQLLDFLHAKQALLVLDNFEHLLEGASLVADLLQAAPGVKVLATSQERLNLEGETVYTLAGMPYPDQLGGQNIIDYGAMQLFVECAHRADPRFIAHDLEGITRVCQEVQGMPLALELAAVWVGKLSPAEIAEEITLSADFLSTTMRNVPERLRSVRSVFETTWRRLTDDERRVFRHLSVFRGGCTREAAQDIADADLGTLAALIDKALLWHGTASGRYQVHELLRQYAAEQLETAGEADAAWKVYQAYFGRLALRWATALKTDQQLMALDALEADFDNIREAFQRASASGEPEVIEPFADLWYYYEIRGQYEEGITAFSAAIEKLAGQESIALGKLLAGQALLLIQGFGQFEQAQVCAERSIDLLRRLATDRETILPIMALGNSMLGRGNSERASTLYDEAFALAQSYNDQWALSILLFSRGRIAYQRKQIVEAKALISQAHRSFANHGNVWASNFALDSLAYQAFESRDYEEALRLYQECLTNARKLRHPVMMSAGLWGSCAVAIAKGELGLAKRLAEDRLDLETHLGSDVGVVFSRLLLAEIAMAGHDDQEAREHLRTAAQLTNDARQYNVLWIVFHSAKWFAQNDFGAEAVVLVSFLDQHPIAVSRFPERDKVTLHKLLAKTQVELPADVYQAAWEQGQTLTVDDLLTKLRTVL